MKSSKRIISIVISLVMIFSVVFSLTACDNTTGNNCENGHQYDTTTGICSVCGATDPSFSGNHVHEFTEYRRKNATCLKDGSLKLRCLCGETKDEVLPKLGHNYEEQTSYSRVRLCQNEGCNAVVFPKVENTFRGQMVYTFTEGDKTRIDEAFQALKTTAEGFEKYDATKHAYVENSEWATLNANFEEALLDFEEEIDYVGAQYQYAKVQGDVNFTDDKAQEDALYIANYYDEVIANYYSLFLLAYESCVRDYFYYGWTAEEIEEALNEAGSSSNPEKVTLSQRNDEIEKQFNDLPSHTSATVLDLYEEFVANNNKIAQIYGYANYMEYAYDRIYGREYTPEVTATYFENVKEYVSPLYKKYEKEWNDLYNKATTKQRSDFLAFLQDSFFINRTVNKSVNDFLEKIVYTNAEGEKVSYYDHLQDLMGNGNYFTGTYEGAYSWYIQSLDTPIIYFGDGYDSGNTVIHEFGHHVNSVKNHGVDQSYDLDETHSQGLEVLYLSQLKGVVTNSVYNLYKAYNLYNNLWISCVAVAVDAFERAVYTNTYAGTSETALEIMADNQITKDEYDALFADITAELGVEGYDDYWRQVTIRSAGYYVSYSISMICSLQFFCDEANFADKVDSYLFLVNYTDEKANVNKTYKELLELAGLYSYEDVRLFQYLKSVLA